MLCELYSRKKAQCFSDKCTSKIPPDTPAGWGWRPGRWASVPGSGLQASGREWELECGCRGHCSAVGRRWVRGPLLEGTQRGQHRPRRGPCSCCEVVGTGLRRAALPAHLSPASLCLHGCPPASHPAVIPFLNSKEEEV